VVSELQEGRERGYDVPRPDDYTWLREVQPRSVPSEWLTLDLGTGELAAMALALENPEQILLLDDALARRLAQAAGLKVWGTLRILLEAKARELTPTIEPFVDRLKDAGLWLSDDIRGRVLALAGEEEQT
jgi:predicted nucleic acid-binding protein